METLSSTATSAVSLLLDDEEIVRRVLAGEAAMFEMLMRRHNQRIYRSVRSVLSDEADVEDVMQQAYVNAFLHLRQFEQRAQVSTWLIRIALNEAFARRWSVQRTVAREGASVSREPPEEPMQTVIAPDADPERQAYARELGRVLEAAVNALPQHYRTVFVLRHVEGLSTAETARGLGVGEEAVKTRLHRARAIVRKTITARIGDAATGILAFHADRCTRVVTAVMARLNVESQRMR